MCSECDKKSPKRLWLLALAATVVVVAVMVDAWSGIEVVFR